jgi:hypothetical protein
MIHVVAMKCLIGLPLLIHIELFEGVGVLKIEESELELLCTDSTALIAYVVHLYLQEFMIQIHLQGGWSL